MAIDTDNLRDQVRALLPANSKIPGDAAQGYIVNLLRMQTLVMAEVLDEMRKMEQRLEKIEAQTFSTADIAQAWWISR